MSRSVRIQLMLEEEQRAMLLRQAPGGKPLVFCEQVAPYDHDGMMDRAKGFVGQPTEKRPWINGVCVRQGVAIATDAHRAILLPVLSELEDGLYRAGWVEKDHAFPGHRAFAGQEPEIIVPSRFLRVLAEKAIDRAEGLDPAVVFYATGAGCGRLKGEGRLGDCLVGPVPFPGHEKLPIGRQGGAFASPTSDQGVFDARYIAAALKGTSGPVKIGPVDSAVSNWVLSIWREDGERHIIMPRTDRVKNEP